MCCSTALHPRDMCKAIEFLRHSYGESTYGLCNSLFRSSHTRRPCSFKRVAISRIAVLSPPPPHPRIPNDVPSNLLASLALVLDDFGAHAIHPDVCAFLHAILFFHDAHSLLSRTVRAKIIVRQLVQFLDLCNFVLGANKAPAICFCLAEPLGAEAGNFGNLAREKMHAKT